MPARVSHIPRTQQLLRKHGWICQVVEKRKMLSVKDEANGGWRQVPGGITVDLYGIGDLLCIKRYEHRPMLVQVCAESGLSAHFKKARECMFKDGDREYHSLTYVLPHYRFWIISWKAVPTKTGNGRRWKPRITEVTTHVTEGFTRSPVIL